MSFVGEIPKFETSSGEFIWLSDTQRTSPLEFWRESNDAERKVLIRAIVNSSPAFLVMGGDLVFSGGSEPDWTEFDDIMAPIRDKKIPVVSAFGNHEYWLDWYYRSSELVEKFFYERFPHLKACGHWFTVEYGPLRLIILDSNQGHGPIATERGWKSQLDWYTNTLNEFEENEEVKGVLVVVHHPPFTNSTITSDETHVQETFVPGFIKSKKTMLMLSGHVHSYERFEKHEKTFVVSGGGGGPRAPLRKHSNKKGIIGAYNGAKHKDSFDKENTIRSFNFIRLAVSSVGLRLSVTGLAKGGTETFVLDEFELPFAK